MCAHGDTVSERWDRVGQGCEAAPSKLVLVVGTPPPSEDPIALACPDSDGISHNIVPSKATGTQSKRAQDIDSDSFFSLLMLKVPHPPPLLVLEGESNSQDQSHVWWPGWWNAVEPSELDGEGTESRAFGG